MITPDNPWLAHYLAVRAQARRKKLMRAVTSGAVLSATFTALAGVLYAPDVQAMALPGPRPCPAS